MIYQNVIFFITLFQDFLCCIAVLGYSHRQSRGFRREEHTAAHVLCLFEPVGRVAQNMSKKACGTNRKRSMSVGIVGEQEHEKGIKYTNHTTLPLRAFPTFLYPFHRYRRTEDNTQCNGTCHLESFQPHRGSHSAVIHDQVVRSIIDSGTRN